MQLEIITPEAEIFVGEADAVQFPGFDGSFQVLNNHAPVIAALAKGDVKVDLTNAFDAENASDKIAVDGSNSKVIRIAIKGGVIEMQNNKVIVLAE